jgi:PEP-CTERM motif
MISFKSKLLNATLAVTAAIPLATAGLFTSAGSAQAAALTGGFNFQAGKTDDVTSSVSLSLNSLTFSPTPTPILIEPNASPSFASFNTALIKNIVNFNTFQANNPFLDFGFTPKGGTIPPVDASLIDNKNIFTLTGANYELSSTSVFSQLVNVKVNLFGYFTSEDGIVTQGEGDLKYTVTGKTKTEVESILGTAGGQVTGLTFAGGYFAATPVPEPAALLGLGAVGAVMVMSRRRKSILQ